MVGRPRIIDRRRPRISRAIGSYAKKFRLASLDLFSQSKTARIARLPGGRGGEAHFCL